MPRGTLSLVGRPVQVGTVLLMCWDEIPEEAALRTLLTGQPTRLESQFRLTYNMILNLLRVEDLKVRDPSLATWAG